MNDNQSPVWVQEFIDGAAQAEARTWAARAQKLRPVDDRDRRASAHENFVAAMQRLDPGFVDEGDRDPDALLRSVVDVLHEVVNGLGFLVAHFVGDAVVDDFRHAVSPSARDAGSDSAPAAGNPRQETPAAGGLSDGSEEA